MNKLFFFLILFIVISLIALVALIYLFWSTQKTLLRSKVSWSSKDIPLKRNKGISKNALLQEIDNQSREYLNSQREEN
tara:strand:- start:247 stop:480 length:234 start_codon:yes stop_codon:yes gene_type:complete